MKNESLIDYKKAFKYFVKIFQVISIFFVTPEPNHLVFGQIPLTVVTVQYSHKFIKHK